METGLNSELPNKRGGSVEPKVGPFVPKIDRNPRDLHSWAKRTGFVSDYSGEAGTSGSEKFESFQQRGRGSSSSPKIEIDPVLGRMSDNRGVEIKPTLHGGVGLEENVRNEIETDGERNVGFRGNCNGGNGGNGHGVSAVAPVTEEKDEEKNVVHDEVKVNLFDEEGVEHVGGGWKRPSELSCGLTENPDFVSLIYYGLQHYLSLAGSLVLIPLVMVPVMGGTDKDTATVISTMLFFSGITTILHVYFSTRLPLVQGSSFVYLAPALVIINAQEYQNLTEHDIMARKPADLEEELRWMFLAYRFIHESLSGMLFIWEELKVL